MSESLYKWKRDIGLRLRDWLERWRALPRERQWQIGGGLFAVSSLVLVVVAWLVFSRPSPTQGADEQAEVVVYAGVERAVFEPIIAAFEASSNIKVRVVENAADPGKLAQRLIDERQEPGADVWWSADPGATVTVAQQGLLDPYISRQESTLKEGWPKSLRSADKVWYGFAQRVRVLAYNSNELNKSTAPARLRDLTTERFGNRVGMTRPQGGAGRTYIAALIALYGEEPTRDLLKALLNNGLKVYETDALTAQALSAGEVHVALLDSAQAWAAKNANAPVEFVYESADRPNVRVNGLPSSGPVVLPATLGKVRGSRHPTQANRLIDFLLGSEVESMLAESGARHIPVRPEVAKKLSFPDLPTPAPLDLAEMNAAGPKADRLIKALFPPPT